MIIDPNTGQEIKTVQTIGTRPKGVKPSQEEFDQWDSNDEDDILI